MLKELAPNVYKIEDQYFYGNLVGVYLIELKDKVLLFDLPSYVVGEDRDLPLLLMEKIGNKQFVAILSHGSCGIADGSKWQQEFGLKVYLHKYDKNHVWLRMKPDIFFKSDFQLDPAIQIIHVPGHSPGSICMLHKPSKILFIGDSIYFKNGKLFLDEDMENRKEYLKVLLDYNFEQIWPFHYEPVTRNADLEFKRFMNVKL